MQPLQTAVLKQVDRPVAIAFGFIVVLLLAGSLYSSSFLSANYLLQQLQVAAFLGLIASGVMLVILLISVPFAFTGALGLSILTDSPIGIPSMIGMLMLIGIAAAFRMEIGRAHV